jgi:hypothetical protein
MSDEKINKSKGSGDVLTADEQLEAAIKYLRESENMRRAYRGLLEILEEFKDFKERISASDLARYEKAAVSLTDIILEHKEAGHE